MKLHEFKSFVKPKNKYILITTIIIIITSYRNKHPIAKGRGKIISPYHSKK